MQLTTKRLILRPWQVDDAKFLYEYAKDLRVGPMAGWPAHKNLLESRTVIEEVLMVENTYAICLKENNQVIGSIGLMIGERSKLNLTTNEAEIGYWVGVPFWGQGLTSEAVIKLLCYSFKDLGLEKVWCQCNEDNYQSIRVQEKCGFKYHHTNEGVYNKLLDKTTNNKVSVITKSKFLQKL